MSRTGLPLAGRTIALPEMRESLLLASMIEEKGGTPVRCPLVAIHDVDDAAPVLAWLEELSAGRFDDLILMTGEGLRRLIGFAERAGVREGVIAALEGVRKITRGPKPARALREIGLGSDLAVEPPTTDGVIQSLSREPLAGRHVGVQLYAQVPNPRLEHFLHSAGATVSIVAPYVYAPASDEGRVLELVGRLARGEIDVIAFTSAAQVERLWEVAERRGAMQALSAGLQQTRVAAVGPVVANELERRGVAARISPATSFFMRPLVNEIVKAIGSPGAS